MQPFQLHHFLQKTKTQVFNDPDLAEEQTLFSIGEEIIENVQQFTYLGQVISCTKKVSFTDYRTARATAKFNELRNILTDKKINMKTRKKLLESCVRSRLVYGTQAWLPNEQERKKLEVCWLQMLRNMVKGGWKRRNVPEDSSDDESEADYSFVYNNKKIQEIVRTQPLETFINSQYLKYIGHVCRGGNTSLTKKMLFAKPTKAYFRDPWIKISKLLGTTINLAKQSTQSREKFAELVKRSTNPPP